MSKKRYLAAFGVAGLVFAAVYGAAAALNVNGGVTQAGTDNSLECDSVVRVASYLVDAEPPAQSSGVRIVDVSTDCDDERLYVRVLDGRGVEIARGTADTIEDARNGNGDVVVRYVGGSVDIRSIEEIALTID